VDLQETASFLPRFYRDLSCSTDFIKRSAEKVRKKAGKIPEKIENDNGNKTCYNTTVKTVPSFGQPKGAVS